MKVQANALVKASLVLQGREHFDTHTPLEKPTMQV